MNNQLHVHISKATISNIEELASIHVNAWQQAYKKMIPKEYLESLSVNKRKENFHNDFTNKPDLEFYFIQCNGENAGILIMRNNINHKCIEILAFYLLKSYWHRGIGTSVMNLIKEKLKNLQFKKITLWVLDENKQAIKFYEKNNFIKSNNYKSINLGNELLEIEYVFHI